MLNIVYDQSKMFTPIKKENHKCVQNDCIITKAFQVLTLRTLRQMVNFIFVI